QPEQPPRRPKSGVSAPPVMAIINTTLYICFTLLQITQGANPRVIREPQGLEPMGTPLQIGPCRARVRKERRDSGSPFPLPQCSSWCKSEPTELDGKDT